MNTLGDLRIWIHCELLFSSKTSTNASHRIDKSGGTGHAKHDQHAMYLRLDHNGPTGSEYRTTADEV